MGNEATPTTGRLEREEITRAEKLWIEALQRRLKRKENFKQLESQVEVSGGRQNPQM